MKLYKNMLIAATTGLMLLGSCKDDKFLQETLKDKLSTETAYTNKAQFDALSATMYRSVQLFYNTADLTHEGWILGLGTDVCFDPRDDAAKFNNWGLVNSRETFSADWFNLQYQIIKVANTLIEAASKPGVLWLNEAEKTSTLAEGYFFRGFAYRNLANLYGGVPIVDKPIMESKVDFVKSTREQVYAFAKSDLEYARTYLPLTTTTPGRVVRAAADHVLAEVNISLKDYDGAIAAATRVIDGTDGAYALVNARFGARANEADKNYYYDLFVMGNQNRQAGNTEGIFVAQFEQGPTGAVVLGGTQNFGRPLIERMMWCYIWGFQKGGYTSGSPHDTTGRGVAYVRPTNYTNYTIWKNAGNDLRNTEVNIKRKYYFNAAVGGFAKGDLIPKSYLTLREDTMQWVYPNWQKFGTDKHIAGLPDNGYVRDFYVIRLPETYLLRAEARLAKGGQAQLVADDINAVRARAQAPLVSAANATLDYILDERARELFGEEFRMMTLTRLGKLYERTKAYGYEKSAASVQTYNNLMPIPQDMIDRNVGAFIPNNPGY
ncbi:RagB/SusD family nutrient uptake outer membrane protein [Pedobacter sp. MC2016-14]|uniref:RagB/SusD family nutrient uptake outer membrane protein n=1 Tax=Pedobacter sp. MC2016-14 TaxID=2897327 RepID=UPI001E5AE547|nr:RagB/SusD family nutrient uptake outer membrane protein [Pedobacter sp. MC2016-14]MCD0486671.1 RagB/SusD family nutrient uptake outer membrane protein [Pedobacter sp. MC2016-14]